MLLLRVTTSVAELFGPGSWTAVQNEAVEYDGLKGWLASFYAGHTGPQWLPISTLYGLSVYESHMRNFRARLIRALEKLKAPRTPTRCHVAKYYFSKDGKKICVVRSEWNAGINDASDA
ncbi:hypothetical protein [Burkholderia vietnamiensis]|uniref:hypothetical protein n=1 Tax=Burkholderia vietnamiensis TaxID=60552 RepID=UPI0015940835|nr:hypothetical protein [Burkholderia vietnamiensis]MCA8070021.1 hypothetical protein [Burkholderia vietnamiensis]